MQNQSIDRGRAFDWGRTSKDYARFRNIYPNSFYRKLQQFGIGLTGQRLLDLGTGTGIIPINLHRAGVIMTGVDISSEQIEVAKEESSQLQPPIQWLVRDAVSTGLPDGSYDAITAVQCWQYFERDKGIKEIERLLTRCGLACIAFMGWLPEEDEITAKSVEIVRKYNPQWDPGGTSRHIPGRLDLLGSAFFLQTYHTYDEQIQFSRESWTGRMRACRGIAASLAEDMVETFCLEHMKMLENETPPSFTVKHQIVYYVFCKR